MNTSSSHSASITGRLFAVILFAGVLTAGGGGCRAVQPWERATLSDYTMRPDRDPLSDSLKEHVYFTRETASGGRGVGGGGCGCN